MMKTSLGQLAARWLKQTAVYQVSNPDNWALYWVAYFTAQHLRERHHLTVHQTPKVWGLKGQIIHFVDRYVYLHGNFRALHPSNINFLTWYHGDLTDPNPDIQQIFALLPQGLPYLQGITTSCQTSRRVLLEVGVPDEQIHLIPIGIDLPRFHPPTPAERLQVRQEFGIPAEAVCIGSFQKDGQGWDETTILPKLIKGPDIFLGVIEQLAKTIPNLLVFLTGPTRGYVKQGLDKLGVPYVHQFFDEYDNVARCYHALDLYIITSRSEGGPKALMESWATGVPVVSTRMGMPADWIRVGENGLLAEVEDVQGLAEAAQKILTDPLLRAECVRGGLEAVKALDWAILSDQFYALYQPFLAK